MRANGMEGGWCQNEDSNTAWILSIFSFTPVNMCELRLCKLLRYCSQTRVTDWQFYRENLHLLSNVSDPHWFKRGSGSSILGQCVSGPRSRSWSRSMPKSLKAIKEEHPALQNLKFHHFFLLVWVIFALLDPDPTDQIHCGSGSEILLLAYSTYTILTSF